jgi:hypothetical protein
MKPKLYVGGLTNAVFCATNYAEHEGKVLHANTKHDVTEDFVAVARELGWAPDARAKSIAHDRLRQAVRGFLGDIATSAMGTPWSWRSYEALQRALTDDYPPEPSRPLRPAPLTDEHVSAEPGGA